jgi:hypothetical protein
MATYQNLVHDQAPARRPTCDHSTMLILAVKEATERHITIRSPVHLRPLLVKGSEFCNQPFNRGAGAWKCPYCDRAWPQRHKSMLFPQHVALSEALSRCKSVPAAGRHVVVVKQHTAQ